MRDEIELILATVQDAGLLHRMKYESFLFIYEKYQDDETNPVKEKEEKVIRKITSEGSDYFIIRWKNENVGGVRVVEHFPGVFYISPLYILPAFQNQGIGYGVIQKLFERYKDAVTWRLETILQEKGNCHLYEKCGFVQTGKKTKINDLMTLVDYEKSNVTARRFRDEDAQEVSNLMIRNFKEINSRDYEKEVIEELVKTYDAQLVRQRAEYGHMYVFEYKEQIVGVGAISSFWGSETESILLTIFVLPELHGKGIGRLIIQTLENDELFLRAERIEIPASITGTEFYRKFGYDFKNGVKKLDEEGHYRLEKFREVKL